MSNEQESGLMLAKRFGVDLLAAASAAFGVSPFICIVDRSIIENASGRRTLKESLKDGFIKLVTTPHKFIASRPFLLIFGVYCSTYTAANTIDTICAHISQDNQMPKFIGTSTVNMVAGIFKDREFTRMFGTTAPRPLPLGTYGLFATRDSLTIAASFNMPDVMARSLVSKGWIGDPERAQNIAQLVCPAAVQFLSTPLHLMGLDLYNRQKVGPNGVPVTWGIRIKFVIGEYWKSAFARVGRIGPAFGIGGVGNRIIKKNITNFLFKEEKIVSGSDQKSRLSNIDFVATAISGKQ